MKLNDISSRLGLSVSTVSRALRNAEGVDTQTRTRVLAEAARAGYRGRQRLVRSGKTRTMLALSRNDSGSISYDAMAGMSQAAIALNVSILTHQTPHDFPESILNPKLQPPAMRTGQLDGIVLLNEWPGAVVSELQQIHPVVSMLYDYPGCDFVGVDEVEGMKTLTSHFGNPGSVGYFGVCAGTTISSRLHAAFLTLRATEKDSPVVEIPHSASAGAGSFGAVTTELSRYFERGVHSWICPDVPCAEILKECAHSLGPEIPDTLQVGVFHPSGRPTATRWTSLTIPGEELGIAAVRRLLHRIEHPSESIRRILLKAGLSNHEKQSLHVAPLSH